MNRIAVHLRPPTVAAVVVLAGCGGGSGPGIDATAARDERSATVPTTSSTSPPAPAGATFVNPLLATGPDPYVVRANGVYYYTQTSGDRIAIWATTAMSRLDRARPVTVFVPPASGPNSRDLWAPELHRVDGKWYVYYAAGDGAGTAADPYPSQRTFVLENEHADPTRGTWTDRGRLATPGPDTWAIDGTVLEHDGRRYFVWSGRAAAHDGDQHLYVAAMANPWTLAGDRVLLSSPEQAWERAGRSGVNEGPQVLRNRAGRVFLVYSAGGCWTDDYALGMLALRDGGDPLVRTDWTKSDTPVFRKAANRGAYGPGHNGFFQSPDGAEDWLVYHANAYPGQGCGDARSVRMQPFRWRDDGTPDFDVPAPVGTPLAVPSGDAPGP